MAIDTRDKRASVLGVSGEWSISLPTPGAHEQGDRQQVTGVYRGILAGALTVSYVYGLVFGPDYAGIVYGPDDEGVLQ